MIDDHERRALALAYWRTGPRPAIGREPPLLPPGDWVMRQWIANEITVAQVIRSAKKQERA